MVKSLKTYHSEIVIIGQTTSGLISFISVILLARYLGATAFTYCSTYFVVTTVAMTILDFGSSSYSSRQLAAGEISTREYFFILKAKSFLSFACVCVALPFSYLLVPAEFKWSSLLLFYPILWMQYNYFQQFMIIQGKFILSQTLATLDRLSWMLIVPMSFIKMDKSLTFVATILIGLTIHNIICFAKFKRYLVQEDSLFEINQISIFRNSRKFGIISTSGIIQNLDSPVVASVIPLADAAGYVLAQRLRNPASIFFSAVAFRIKPLASKRSHFLIIKTLKEDIRLLSFGVLFSLILSLLFLFHVNSLFGESYEKLNVIICIGTLISIPFGIVTLASTILSSIGEESYVAKFNVVQSLTLLFCVAIGAFFKGSPGSVVAALGTFAISAGLITRKCANSLEFLKTAEK